MRMLAKERRCAAKSYSLDSRECLESLNVLYPLDSLTVLHVPYASIDPFCAYCYYSRIARP
jgi:hypothetical protein